MKRVDFQLLLGLRATLFGSNDAIADRRKRAVPEALTRILLQGAQDMLGIFLRLIFVEQRHDLAHHDVHRVVAHLLGNGQQFDAILGELADVELQLEMVTEEARETVNDHHVERRGLAGPRLDHPLELRPAIVGGGRPRLHEGLDQFQPARQAIGFALLALIRNRDIVLGLPRRRDAQIEGSAQRHGHDRELPTSLAWPEQRVEDIAEPRLENIDFRDRDGNPLRPVVGDGPWRKIILRRSSSEWPRIAE